MKLTRNTASLALSIGRAEMPTPTVDPLRCRCAPVRVTGARSSLARWIADLRFARKPSRAMASTSRVPSPAAAIDALASLTPEERLRWNDRRVDALMEAMDQVRRQRGP